MENHVVSAAEVHLPGKILVVDDQSTQRIKIKKGVRTLGHEVEAVSSKDKYSGIRTGLKTEFTSREEFLVYSFLAEELPAPTKSVLSLEQLKVEECSNAELNYIYSAVRINYEHYPDISDVKNSYFIVNNSELNWMFLEDETKYHSVFWSESESKLFSRCARLGAI